LAAISWVLNDAGKAGISACAAPASANIANLSLGRRAR
jgi:hypothetical protein